MPAAVASKKHVASYTIQVDGQDIDKTLADRVREVRVVSSLASPDVCTLKILFDKPRKAGEPQPIDKMPFDIGKQLHIKLGDKESLRPESLFKGEIVTLEPEFGSGGVQLLIRAFDPAHKLHRARHVRAFQNQTASDIVSKVCREASVPVQCDASGGPLEYMQQSNETDWDFISRLADRAGFEFVVIEGKAHFRRPSNATGVVELEYPTSLFQFHPRVTAVQQVDSVEVRSFDPETKAVLRSQKTTPNLLPEIGLKRDQVRSKFKGSKILVPTEPVHDQGQADQTAQSLLDRMSNGYVTAEGLTFGNPKLRGGATINVKGVGTKFGGKYRIHTATHLLRGGSTYETHFTNAPGHTIAGMIGGGAGGAGGTGGQDFAAQVVLAKVTNNKDPKALGRVRVWYPTLGQDNEGTWARVATPSAGKERGLMMLPVVGEEVLVCFEHNDITRPYVIGSLFNGKDTPGTELAQEKGGFGLRSDDIITMNSKKATAVVSEDEMSLASTKDLKLDTDAKLLAEAAQDVKLKGGTTVVVEAGSTLTIKGQGSVKIESTGSVEMSGASVKVSAQGVLQISGSQIMLG